MATRRLPPVAVVLLVSAACAAPLAGAVTRQSREGRPAQGPTERRGRMRQGQRRSAQPTITGLSAHREQTDPDIAKALAAFGAEDYAKARSIAEEVLKKPDRGTRRSEAVDLIVESWLQQGDFDQARAAAKKHSKLVPNTSKEALARINAQEADYRNELKQLQNRKRKAKKPEDIAHIGLLIGHTHQKVGRFALAEQSYRDVISRYPKTRAAAMAKRQIQSMRERTKRKPAR